MTTESQFTSRHLRYNTIVLCALISAPQAVILVFGDVATLIPNLVHKLDGPMWLASLPMVMYFSVAYLPQPFMAWYMMPHMSRKHLYAMTLAIMFVPVLLLAIALSYSGSATFLLGAVGVCAALFTLAMGLSILPCWDLYGRIFPDHCRGRIMGISGGIVMALTIPLSAVAGWLISSRSPFEFPKDYAVAMGIFFLGGVLITLAILFLREFRCGPSGTRPPFRSFVRDVVRSTRADREFMHILGVTAVAAALVAVPAILLVYAKEHRQFGDDQVALLITLRPWLYCPMIVACGYLADRVGHLRVTSIAAGLLAAGTGLLLAATGPVAVLAALMLTALSPLMYMFSILAVLSASPPGRAHIYLAVYYVMCMIPGLSPLALAWLAQRQPNISLGIIVGLALACAAAGLCFGKRPAPKVEPPTTP